ncbi:hypothetical protein U1Q18_031907 [Sarracenia purpurea var. burkii]
MGGCASKPKELDAKQEPLLAEEPTSPQKPKTEADNIAPQEDNGGETKKEEALVESAQPAEEAPESKEPSTESEPAEANKISEETANPEEGKVEAAVEEEKKEVEADGEKKLAE